MRPASAPYDGLEEGGHPALTFMFGRPTANGFRCHESGLCGHVWYLLKARGVNCRLVIVCRVDASI